MKTARALLLSALLLSLAGPAAAQDAAGELGLQMRTVVDRSRGRPAFVFAPQRDVKKLTILLARDDAAPSTLRVGRLRAGQERVVEFNQPEGTFSYSAQLEGQWADGAKIDLRITFESTSVEPLRLRMDKKDVDLDAQRLRFYLDRSPERVEYVVIGDGGRVLDSGESRAAVRPGEPIEIRWSSGDATVEKIQLKAFDRFGFWVGQEVIPFTVFIPHDEVEFAFGEASIPPSEEGKLDATLARLEAALDRHGGEIEIQLFVAGYTDTVGTRSANLELSERRARAIATWFRRKGVRVPIFYQGFGEDVPAVPTPDETREARNRRAIYVLSAGPPAPCQPIPADRWKPL